MASSVILVSANSGILHDPSTKILHRYTNGEVLVRTDTATNEAGDDEVTAVLQGVQLDGISEAAIQSARNGFANFARGKAKPKSARARYAIINEAAPPALVDIEMLAYVELIGPVDPVWLETLANHGLKILRYQPANSYLCRGLSQHFQAAAAENFVLQITPLTEALKRQTIVSEAGEERVWIVALGKKEDAPELIAAFRALPGVTIDSAQPVEQVDFYLRIPANVSAEGQDSLLKDASVIAVEPFAPAVAEDEVAGLILAEQYNASGKPAGSYLRWLEDCGVNGRGVTIGIVDGGVDVTHPAFKGRVKDLAGGAKSWHGTFVAGHVAGCFLEEKDKQNFIYGLGTAPASELLAQDKSDVTTTPGRVCNETVTATGPGGVTGSIQNNSWGAGTRNPMDYGSLEAAYDSLVRNSTPDSSAAKPLTICFSSGNSGASGLTRPKAAKNILVTGNSENYRLDAGGAESDNINEVYTGQYASSHGNCGDGRIRPHIVAPGEWTTSANYDSLPGQREFVSPRITYGGGSSGASPKTAGVCALLTQWWKNNNRGQLPSPALLRALVVNGAVEMNMGGPIPNKYQGWGRLSVAGALAKNSARLYEDQTILLTTRGQVKEWRVRASNPNKPIKITLAWSDPPGPIGSGTATVPAIVNKLALRVEANDNLYRGNHFRNGWAEANPTPNREGWDNLQNVYLPVGVATGVLRVTVMALELTTNCLTGRPDQPRQDFALVITNGQLDSGATPPTIAVAVPPVIPPPTPPPNPSSVDDDDFDWWSELDQASDNGSATPVSYNDSPVADDWWKNDFAWFKSETEKSSAETERSVGPQLTDALRAGLDVIAAHGGNIAGASEETARDEAAAILARPFAAALIEAIKGWRASSTEGIVRQRTAVIVVNGGTRVTNEELKMLQQLSFQGQIYLVAESAPVLAQLAQRLRRQTNIEFRLARDPAEFPSLVRDTLAEASGAQEVCFTSMITPTEGILTTAHRFDVVAADTQLTIRIETKTGSFPLTKLVLPNQQIIEIDPQTEYAGLKITERPGWCQLELGRNGAWPQWAGPWELLVNQPDVEASATSVNIWALSGLHLSLRESAAPDDQAAKEVLVAVSGNHDVRLSRLQIVPRVIAEASTILDEAEREVTVTVQPARLDREAAAVGEETIRAEEIAVSSSLSTRLPLLAAVKSTTILELLLTITGIEANGQPFQRLIRRSLIRLPSVTDLRMANGWAHPLLFIGARIRQVHYTGNIITGLRLQRGNRARNIYVIAPQVREQLSQLELKGKQLHFCITGDELLGVICITKQ